MMTNDKISVLRELMEREGLDAYIVSGTDPHNSEYLPAAWKQREWISGFTGSFGTVVVTRTESGLWTDTRYFLQAEKQLAGTEIQLHRLRIPEAVDYPEWLASVLPSGSKVGVDSFCISVEEMQRLREKLEACGIKIAEKTDLMGEIWLDRPALPETPLFLVDEKIAGSAAAEKIGMIRKVLADRKADHFLFGALDEIAWLCNIRCNDIAYNPVAISYVIVGHEKTWLFVKRTKVSREISTLLAADGIEVMDYHHLGLFLEELPTESVFCLDPATLNYATYSRILSRFGKVIHMTSPVILAKSVKNQAEIEGFRKACVKDGVALTKFFIWLESNISNHLSETVVSDKLTSFRANNDGYVSDSFGNISAYGINAALPHYSAIPGEDAVLEPRGLYLVDSGGQYTHGTTDITRTIPLGELTDVEKEDYTIVLKGMIDLACTLFPKGTRGCNLDIVARQPLWDNKRNFGHGTGHGIGFFLNVHEGPQSIRQDLKDQPLLPGMVTSDEPGIYREGSHGIRHENMILCIPAGNNEFGEWYGFETLTLCYFDTSAILTELLTAAEKSWLNEYHRTVYERLSPFLDRDEAAWLAGKTASVK